MCAITYAFISRSARTAGAWRGFHLKEAFSGWGSYLRIALLGVLFLAESGAGEFLVFTAASCRSPRPDFSALANSPSSPTRSAIAATGPAGSP